MKDRITIERDCIVFRPTGELIAGAGSQSLSALCETAQANLEGIKAVVFDLGGKIEFDGIFVKELGLLIRIVKPAYKRIYVVQAPKPTEKLLQDLGMDGAIQCKSSLDAVFADLGQGVAAPLLTPSPAPATPPKNRINVEFINPFIDGAMETLKTQCSTQCKPAKLFIKGSIEQEPADIAGVLGITSPGFRGSLAICFPKRVFLGLMERMLGEKAEEITAELQDGAGELLNIIFGFAKRVLNEKGYQLEKAIPTVLRGSGIVVKHLGPGPSIVLPFQSDLGVFYIEICSDSTS